MKSERREPMVRLAEELKYQRALIKTLIEQMEKRFAAVVQRCDNMDKRFDSMDQRFEMRDKRLKKLSRRIDRFRFWSFGLTTSVGAGVVAALRWSP